MKTPPTKPEADVRIAPDAQRIAQHDEKPLYRAAAPSAPPVPLLLCPRLALQSRLFACRTDNPVRRGSRRTGLSVLHSPGFTACRPLLAVLLLHFSPAGRQSARPRSRCLTER